MLRLFTGIEIEAPVAARLTEALRFLRPTAELQWSRDENLHITTKFIGAWAQDNLEAVIEALHRVELPAAFEVAVGEIGYFPNANTPRVLMARVAQSPPLNQLVSRTEDALEALGVAREERPYTPHITLARIRRGTKVQTLREAISRQPNDFGTFHARRFHLYRSENGVYTSLTAFPVH